MLNRKVNTKLMNDWEFNNPYYYNNFTLRNKTRFLKKKLFHCVSARDHGGMRLQ